MTIVFKDYKSKKIKKAFVKSAIDFVEMANGQKKAEFIGQNDKGGWSFYSIYTEQIIKIEG